MHAEVRGLYGSHDVTNLFAPEANPKIELVTPPQYDPVVLLGASTAVADPIKPNNYK